MRPGDAPEPETSPTDRTFGVARRFAADLRAGRAGPIERYLDPGSSGPLRALIVLELGDRRGRGEAPALEGYLARFPGRPDVVRDAFLEPTEVALPGDAPASTEGGPTSDGDGRGGGLGEPDGRRADGTTELYPSAGHSAAKPDGGTADVEARYTLDRWHKSGGIGEVWRAHDHQLGRDVALKRLKADRLHDPAIRARFLREARITGQLQHPGIVPVFDLARLPAEDEPFYTMRFIEGPTLSDAAVAYARRRRAGQAGLLDLRQLLGSFLGACQVVAYANSRGVIHRDLKGQNVVLGDFGEVMVLDWGLAKVVTAPGEGAPGREAGPSSPIVDGPGAPWDDTTDGAIMGTPGYMPPEQALGRLDLVDGRSDVYGLGAILYEILTGEPPFRGPKLEVLRRVVHEPPVPPRRKAESIPRALEAICLKCLAKPPEGRYPSALALAGEVQKFLADEPVDAYEEPWTARARRWASRRRTLVTTSVAVLLITSIALSASTILLQLANRRESRLKQEEARARARAEHSEALTLRAVDSFFTGVAGDAQLKTFGLEKLRQKLLVDAKGVLEQLIRARSRRPGVDLEHGRNYLRLAEITEKLGDHEDAVEMALQARSILGGLAKAYPDEASYRRLEAEALDTLGLAYASAYRHRQAIGALEEATALWESLASRKGRPPEVARLLVANLNRRGRLLCLALHDPAGAEAVLLRARGESDRLARDVPGDRALASEQVETTLLLGLARGSEDPEAASRLFEQGLARREALASSQPEDIEEQANLVENCVLIASYYSNHRVPGRIPALHTKARSIAAGLAKRHPDVPLFAENAALIEILYSIHVALSGDHAGAAGAVDRALSTVGPRSGLAKLYAACLLSMASDVARKDPAHAGAVRDRCVERYQARAMALLLEARATGLFLMPTKFEGVRAADPDLIPSRSNFRQFENLARAGSTLDWNRPEPRSIFTSYSYANFPTMRPIPPVNPAFLSRGLVT